MSDEWQNIVARLRSPLPVCPFDRRSPDYWTTGNDGKPCPVCGGTEEGPDKCRGADTRCMDEAADLIERLAAAPSPPVSVEQAGIMGATGWAIVTDGVIDVTTVSPMRRAAIINWLVTNRGQLIFNHHTDEQIESWWAALRGTSEAVVVIVNAALQQAPANDQ